MNFFSGRFLTEMSSNYQDWNFLGLEIRRPVTASCLRRREQRGLNKNLYFVCCNCNVDMDRLLNDARKAEATIDRISIQFPDPHVKLRHHKRRVMQPDLARCIENHLSPGGQLFMQSDLLDVVYEMREICQNECSLLEDSRNSMDDWTAKKEDLVPPLAKSEREVATLSRGDKVYSALFTKRKHYL